MLKQQSSTGMLRSTILKHMTSNRLTGSSMKEKAARERSSGPTDSFTARFFDGSGREFVVPWKRSGHFEDLKKLVCAEFNFPDCDVYDVERHLRLNSDSEIKLMVDEWNERDSVRKKDILATWVLQVQQQLTNQEPEMGLHALWELACRPENHVEVEEALFEQVSRECRALVFVTMLV